MDRLGCWIAAALLSAGGCSGLLGKAGQEALSRAPTTTLAVPGDATTMGDATTLPAVGAPRISGAIVRSQLLALIGKEPAAARAALESYGHDGEVKVAPGPRFYDDCGKDRVCAFDVPESGMGIHDPITLYVNPGLQIAAPAP